jgi:hypothetical protein
LMTAGGAPTAPASPAPLTPSGLAVEGTLWVEKAKSGTSPARGGMRDGAYWWITREFMPAASMALDPNAPF